MPKPGSGVPHGKFGSGRLATARNASEPAGWVPSGLSTPTVQVCPTCGAPAIVVRLPAGFVPQP
jgi:hypothetical protein